MADKHYKFDLPDRSYSGIIKKGIRQLGKSSGFGDSKLGELDIIVSELLSNLVKFAGARGEFLVKTIEKSGINGLEILCIDNGVGMKYPEKMLADGVSTGESLGQGLGAIRRLSDEFDLYSLPQWGTIILCRIYLKKISEKRKQSYGGVTVPVDKETKCGDSWEVVKKGNMIRILAVDGLGHGVNANRAASAAIDCFIKSRNMNAIELLETLHTKIKSTRGAVCFNANINTNNDTITYLGIGNISAKIISAGTTKNCVSFNGIVGYAMPARLKESTLKWQGNDIFIIHSDGINSRWDISLLDNIERHDPVTIAAALYKDNKRGNDDSLVLVIKREVKGVG